MTFKIEEPLKKAKHINLFCLKIENMHGDADAYTTEKILLPDNEDSKEFLKDMIELCTWSQSKWPSREAIGNKYDSIAKKHAKLKVCYPDGEIASFEEFGDEGGLVQSDSTADHQFPCRPSVKSLTFFNESGVECKVTYK